MENWQNCHPILATYIQRMSNSTVPPQTFLPRTLPYKLRYAWLYYSVQLTIVYIATTGASLRTIPNTGFAHNNTCKAATYTPITCTDSVMGYCIRKLINWASILWWKKKYVTTKLLHNQYSIFPCLVLHYGCMESNYKVMSFVFPVFSHKQL